MHASIIDRIYPKLKVEQYAFSLTNVLAKNLGKLKVSFENVFKTNEIMLKLCCILMSTIFGAIGHPFTMATSNPFLFRVVRLATISAAVGRLEHGMFHN